MVIDADKMAREAVAIGSVGLNSLVNRYGDRILQKDKSLDRHALASIIFSDKQEKQFVEQTLHPLIQIESEKVLIRNDIPKHRTLWFYEAALIIETKRQSLFVETWLVTCSVETQRTRLAMRDGFNSDDVDKRLSNQMTTEEKAKSAQFILDTDQELSELYKKIAHRITMIKNRSQ